MLGEALALTWNPATGTFLLASQRDDFFYSVTTAGVATDIGSTPEHLKGLAFVGAALYGASVFSTSVYNLNPLDGSVISSVGVSMAGDTVNGLNGLASDPDTGLLYGIVRASDGDRHLATIVPTTGVASDIGEITGGDGWAGLAFGPAAPAPVPEPATILLLGTGLAAVAVRRRFKSRP